MTRAILFLLLVHTFSVNAQLDTLFLLNGKIKSAKIDTFDSNFVFYKKVKKDGKLGKKRKKNLDHIFSIQENKQEIRYIYRQDSMIDNYLSLVEMDFYLKGRRQAKKHFKPRKTLIMGATVGTGIALYSLFPIKYGSKERFAEVLDTVTNRVYTTKTINYQTLSIPIPFWEILPLGVYVYYNGAAKNTENFNADNPDLFQNNAFMIGYKESVIDKKVLAAVGSSLGSYLTTMLGYLVFDPIADK